jgi:hypothetical protein
MSYSITNGSCGGKTGSVVINTGGGCSSGVVCDGTDTALGMGSFITSINNLTNPVVLVPPRFDTAIGYKSLASDIGLGYNTVVGAFSGSNIVSGTYNTAIGYLAGPYSNSLINTVSIGALASPTISNVAVFSPGINVGIGTAAPLATLTVMGNIYANTDLTVLGNTALSNLVVSNLLVTGNLFVTATNVQTTNALVINNAGTSTAFKVYQNEPTIHTQNVAEFWDATTLAMVIDPEGNVAIHTISSPDYSLTVTDPANFETLYIRGKTDKTSLNIVGNIYASNAVTATTYYGNVVASNVVVTPATGVTGINVTGNIYASNAVTATTHYGNVVASNVVVTPATGVTGINVTGNIYASNAVTATTHYGNVVASNVVVTPATGVTGINVTGNLYASNAMTTNNVFVSNINFASTNLGPAVAGQLQYNTYLYGTINTTSGRGSVPTDYIYRLTGTVLSSAITILNFFTGTAAGTGSLINLEASSVYNIEALCYFTKTNAGTITWALNASSAPSHVSASYTASPITGIAASPGTTQAAAVVAYVWSQGQTSTAFAVTGSLTSGVNHSFLFKIQVVTNAATNFGIFATQSALSLTALAGSYYRVTKMSTTTGAFA